MYRTDLRVGFSILCNVKARYDLFPIDFIKILVAVAWEKIWENWESFFFPQNSNLIRWNCSLHFSVWPFPIRKTLWYWLRLRWTIQVAKYHQKCLFIRLVSSMFQIVDFPVHLNSDLVSSLLVLFVTRMATQMTSQMVEYSQFSLSNTKS